MSLINDMLRDLAKRNSPYEHTPVLQGTLEVIDKKSIKNKYLLLTGTLLIIMLCVYGAYQYGKKTANNNFIAQKKKPFFVATLEPTSIASQPVLPVIITQTTMAINIIAFAQTSEPLTQILPGGKISRRSQNVNAYVTRNQLESGQKNSFQNFSTANPGKLNENISQFKRLLDSGQMARATSLLDDSLLMFPDNLQLINARAQIYLSNKNPEAALKILQRSNSHDEVYLSLLASTFQQLNSFAEATSVYAQLLGLNPERAQYWLGLAISQEKLGNVKAAREAYLQALSKNTLNETVTSYIKQRLGDIK